MNLIYHKKKNLLCSFPDQQTLLIRYEQSPISNKKIQREIEPTIQVAKKGLFI